MREKRLTIDDLYIPMFGQRPVRRNVPARPDITHLLEDEEEDYFSEKLAHEAYMENPSMDRYEDMMMPSFKPKTEPAIEGVTFSDNFLKIGYTYFLTDGMLFLNTMDKDGGNIRLIEKKIETAEDFEKCIKQADKKYRKLYF